MGNKILIYAEHATPRLQYACSVLFLTVLQYQECIITTDFDHAQNSDWKKINYSLRALSNSIHIVPHGLLAGKNIAPQTINVEKYNGVPLFFRTGDGPAPFDFFAAAFYLLSRYEEYLPFVQDSHNRFGAKQSLAYRYDFLNKAIVHDYAAMLHTALWNRDFEFGSQIKKYTPLHTFDIDNAYAYRYKGFVRTAGGIIKDLRKLDFNNLLSRIASITKFENDPYDVYDYILASANDKFNIIFFFMTADTSKYDRNMPYSGKKFRQLVQFISSKCEVGIHPGYYTMEMSENLPLEISRLRSLTNKPVVNSRQHFLRIKFPESFTQLIAAGITNDYSMGYADHAGFRASIAVPFPFFDLKNNETTSLTLHPITLMDSAFKFYQRLSNELTLTGISDLKKEISRVNGQLLTVFHNETLSEKGQWLGWRKIFESMIK